MISAIVLTKNEENNIVDCLDSLLWCDEIIIVDDYSEDRTIEIIKNLGDPKIKVLQRRLNNDFASQRNFGLEKTRGEWVLFIDADERVTEYLRNEISYLISDSDRRNKLNGYFVKRIDFIWEKELKYGETGNINLLRLAKRHAGQWVGKVHEVWKVKGGLGTLRSPLYHYPHQTITKFLQEINFYTDIRAKELLDRNVEIYWWSIILYPIGKFFLNYVVKRGFLDGIEGFVFATLMSFHSFLVRGKLWLLWQKK